jgi:hypothetical protein
MEAVALTRSTLEWAKYYRDAGLSVIPLRPQDKRPAIPWKPYQQCLASDEELVEWFGKDEANIGIVCGAVSGGLVVADFDNALNLRSFLDVLPELEEATVRVTTARGGHIYLITTETIRTFQVEEFGLDIKGEGSYVLAPPSIHPSGKPYEFANEATEIMGVANFLAWLQHSLAALGFDWTPPGSSDNGQRTGLDVAAALSGLKQDNRNETFARLVGKLHRGGMTPEGIMALLVPHAERVDFPLPELEEEVKGICGRYARPDSKEEPVAYRAESLDALLAEQDETLQVIVGDGNEGAVLTQDGKGFIAGPTGVGKTNLLLRLSRCLCEATPFLGLDIPHPHTVLYLALEGSRRGTRRRLRKVWAGASDDARRRFTLAFITLNLANEDDLQRLEALLEATKPEVLIIDPLRNAHPFDENLSQEAAHLTGILDGLIDRYRLAIICAHHDRKRPPFVRRDAGTDRVRGSTALTGWLQFCLSLDPDPKEKDVLVAEWTKTRDAEVALSPLVLDFDRDSLDFIVSDRDPSGKVSDDAILNAVFQNGGTYRGPDLVAGLMEGCGASSRWIHERLRALVKDGSLLKGVAPTDRKSGALTYSLPTSEPVEAEA